MIAAEFFFFTAFIVEVFFRMQKQWYLFQAEWSEL
jgi:hypothetical protein